jgi:hypothetical protein
VAQRQNEPPLYELDAKVVAELVEAAGNVKPPAPPPPPAKDTKETKPGASK